MKELTGYWATVCAPTLRERKKELGRAVPEREIAAYVETQTGQDSSRGLVSRWFRGDREPTVSQFIALCNKLDLKIDDVITESITRERNPQVQFVKKAYASRNPYVKTGTKSRKGRAAA